MNAIKTTLTMMTSIMLCFYCAAASCPDCKGTGKTYAECDTCNGHGYVASTRHLSYKNGWTKLLTIEYIDDDGEIKKKQKSFNIDKDDPDKHNAPTWCPKCHKGMKTPGKWGSGKIVVSCSTCNGNGRIDNNANSKSNDNGVALKEIRMTKAQWSQICSLIESSGKVELTKSGIKLVVE